MSEKTILNYLVLLIASSMAIAILWFGIIDHRMAPTVSFFAMFVQGAVVIAFLGFNSGSGYRFSINVVTFLLGTFVAFAILVAGAIDHRIAPSAPFCSGILESFVVITALINYYSAKGK